MIIPQARGRVFCRFSAHFARLYKKENRHIRHCGPAPHMMDETGVCARVCVGWGVKVPVLAGLHALFALSEQTGFTDEALLAARPHARLAGRVAGAASLL